MVLDDSQSRRRILKLTGAAALPAVLAGCGDGGPGGDNGTEEENETEGNGNETEGNETEGNETEGNETEGNETEGNETEENETEEESGDGGGAALEPGEIELGGETQAWQGVAPDEIADEENPTLTLQEGESYEITWENMDGAEHNLEIWDDSDEVVEDYETELVSEEGETQTLEIDEVTSEMVTYVCEPHQGTMNGDIEVQ